MRKKEKELINEVETADDKMGDDNKEKEENEIATVEDIEKVVVGTEKGEGDSKFPLEQNNQTSSNMDCNGKSAFTGEKSYEDNGASVSIFTDYSSFN